MIDTPASYHSQLVRWSRPSFRLLELVWAVLIDQLLSEVEVTTSPVSPIFIE